MVEQHEPVLLGSGSRFNDGRGSVGATATSGWRPRKATWPTVGGGGARRRCEPILGRTRIGWPQGARAAAGGLRRRRRRRAEGCRRPRRAARPSRSRRQLAATSWLKLGPSYPQVAADGPGGAEGTRGRRGQAEAAPEVGSRPGNRGPKCVGSSLMSTAERVERLVEGNEADPFSGGRGARGEGQGEISLQGTSKSRNKGLKHQWTKQEDENLSNACWNLQHLEIGRLIMALFEMAICNS
ncbi:hypothetical protein ACMD2_19060 [Ananas comosus]|uniref:Uncharacterized protein n=1 Tax=Ananas comosus TaxID=4615 RepID=A0A199VMA9_ANACO|nr:hypothetical protein ACMD2_19060 [Ananas comosus]